jgi:glycosidase
MNFDKALICHHISNLPTSHTFIKMKKKIFVIAIVVFTYGIALAQNNASLRIQGHPAWIMQGNIYEVNVRQYTPEGTFNAFAKHLPRLKSMGVQTLWFMPINPISKKDRKGTLGSYYAVSDYTAVNPEHGSMNDWKMLVQKIHQLGMKVIIDWVPNHTGADHNWLNTHPDFFVKDSTGQPATMFDWTDTRVLDFKNLTMQDSMINAMKFWITSTKIDGFRCDVAWNVPGSFWTHCTQELKKCKSDVFMLAEGDNDYLHRSGFDATYPWEMFKMMIKVAAGEKPAVALDSIKQKYDTLYPSTALEMFFTSNHDENSWNKAEYGVFEGEKHAPFAVFTQTMARSVPLIYSGQEEPLLRPLPFFEKDTIVFKNYKRAKFYNTLLSLRKRNRALSADASFKKINVGDANALYAFVRQKGKNKVLVILNFSAKEQIVSLKDKSLYGSTYNLFMHGHEKLGASKWNIEPWGYAVFEYPLGK